MSKDTNDMLFEYIKNTIYENQIEPLDISKLPEDYQKLGAGISQFCIWVQETKQFSEEIAKGNLEVQPPNVENVIAANLKALQGTLRHLTWQAEQIAKGDYNQKVEFMGMFSDAFNRMTEQLHDRTEALANEMHYVSEQNESMRRNNEMFQIFTQKSQEYIIIVDARTGESLYCNDIMKELLDSIKGTDEEQFLGKNGMLNHCPCSSVNTKAQWEYKTGSGSYYSIQSVYIYWDGRAAMAHSFANVTVDKEREEMIEAMAFKDFLTGNYNRRFGMELLEKRQEEQNLFSLGFVDIDFLKYCNDEVGHERGDQYIRNVSDALMAIPTEKTVCRVGGDEFMVIMEGIEAAQAEKYLRQARASIMKNNIGGSQKIPQSFSYGVVDNTDTAELDVSEMLSNADKKMYKYKIAQKEKLKKFFHDNLDGFVDDRLEP
ncbi:MAG: diguanylate cyclase [Lachnospiraceae bacterium]|nr:diguanylate cyclase [Lachnospiraceae bacterium]